MDGQRTFDLTTNSGAITAAWQTVIPLLATIAAFAYAEKYQSVIPVVIGLAVLSFFIVGVLPAWGVTLWRWRNERLLEERRIDATTERVRLAEIGLERAKQTAANLLIMSHMDNDQISLALELERGELFDISGNRVTWTVNGVVMPVTFALDWFEKWEKRRESRPDELPASRDWDNDAHREQCRTYSAAITQALIKLGYVQQAGSQYPARWLYDDDTYRWRGLELIGMAIALGIARGLLEGDNDNG